MILDSLGGPFTDAAIAAIANQGRLVVYGTSNDEQVSINLRRLYRKGVTLLGYGGLVDTPQEQRDALDKLLSMMAAGSLTIPVGDVLPLADAAEAHARILGRERRRQDPARLSPLSERGTGLLQMWRRQLLRRSDQLPWVAACQHRQRNLDAAGHAGGPRAPRCGSDRPPRRTMGGGSHGR